MKLLQFVVLATLLLRSTNCGVVDDVFLTPIKHVIILMLENRSFDHLFGYYGSVNKKVNGLTGQEKNPYIPGGSEYVHVNTNAPDVGPIDPCHGLACTSIKMYGTMWPPANATPNMDYFVAYEYASHSGSKFESATMMEMFPPTRLPVLTSIAENYLLMDRWFAALPGPTWPNRMYALSATSHGGTATNVWYHGNQSYPQKCLFDSVEEAGLEWKYYYVDEAYENFMIFMNQSKNADNINRYDQFLKDAKSGNLPNFAWVTPRMSPTNNSDYSSNDQHPDHSVAVAEKLHKEVYEAIRNSPQWNETLLIFTYDEHGGFYDHVPPPTGVPAPDHIPSHPDYFTFDRLGLRVPTILISPWVEKGKIVGAPAASQKPAANSEFEHSSIPATVKKMFNLKSFLTKRDAWAATFENEFTMLSEPRKDCPETLPDALPVPAEVLEAIKWKKPNDLQVAHLRALEKLIGVQEPNNFETQVEMSQWLEHATAQYHKQMDEAQAREGTK